MLLIVLLLCEWLGRALLESIQARHRKRWEPYFWARCALPLAWLALWMMWRASGLPPVAAVLIAVFLLILEFYQVRPVRECGLPDHWPVVRAHEKAHQLHRHDLFRKIWFVAGATLWVGIATQLSSLPEALLVAHILYFWSRPLTHALRWRQEFQADASAAQHGGAEASLQGLELLRAGSGDWHAAFALQYSSHPPPALRSARLVARGANCIL